MLFLFRNLNNLFKYGLLILFYQASVKYQEPIIEVYWKYN